MQALHHPHQPPPAHRRSSSLPLSRWLRVALSAALLTSLPLTAAARMFASIGTGGVTGVYYPTGGAIAQLVNDDSRTHGMRLTVESTGGSIYNINALLSGDLEFGIAQSDLHAQAWQGEGAWQNDPQPALRSVCALHPEIITLIAAADSGITSLADLAGKRVNLGNPGSGNRANAIDVLTTAGIDWENDLQSESLKAAEAPRLLQDDRLDAFFYTVGHPNGAISEATAGRRPVRFVSVEGVDALLEAHPYYRSARIPIDLYPEAANDPQETISSIGVVTTVVTTETVPDELVYVVTRELLIHFDTFKTLHPALERLEKPDLLQGLTAPLHAGAARAYREAGLLP
jgi:uncharacterized protein